VDYDIDYLQGRVLLSQPLSSTANDNLLVRTSGLSGDEAYLVVALRITPGFGKLDAVAVGGQGIMVERLCAARFTADSNEGDSVSNLGAADLTLRKSANSWFKCRQAVARVSSLPRCNPMMADWVSGPNDQSFTGAKAGAYRADLSVGWAISSRAATVVSRSIRSTSTPVIRRQERRRLRTRAIRRHVQDARDEQLESRSQGRSENREPGLETRAVELDVAYKLAEKWTVSTGVRNDLRKDNSPVVPLTQIQGERTDAVAQVKFDSSASWSAYGFASTRSRQAAAVKAMIASAWAAPIA